MKPRELTKKLSIKKKTVSNLSTSQMNELKGGTPKTFDFNCNPSNSDCSVMTCDPIFCEYTYYNC